MLLLKKKLKLYIDNKDVNKDVIIKEEAEAIYRQ